MNKGYFVVSAAGGNPTVIEVINIPLSRSGYEESGRVLMSLYGNNFCVEQTGSLVLGDKSDILPHFEMSGGEFCGNAARSVALILARILGKTSFRFSMSGVENSVEAKVIDNQVSCRFLNLPCVKRVVSLVEPLISGTLVDLGGIVHVVLRMDFPDNVEIYKEQHHSVVKQLDLSECPAVGVIWVSVTEDKTSINPVVWVRSVDTFYHETSCGSGSIATAVAVGADQLAVTQPTGQDILVEIDSDSVTLTSTMEIIHSVRNNS